MLRPGPNLIRWAKRLPMLALPALLGGCDMVVMNPAGDIAVQQRDLILFSTGVMLLIIVPADGGIRPQVPARQRQQDI